VLSGAVNSHTSQLNLTHVQDVVVHYGGTQRTPFLKTLSQDNSQFAVVTRDSIYAIARYMLSPVRLSVCQTVVS